MIILSYLLLAVYHTVSFIGVLKLRRFALFSGQVLLLYNIASGFILFAPNAILGILISVVAFSLLVRNANSFKYLTSSDKKILLGMVLLIPLYFGIWVFVANLPTAEEVASKVTQEAIEKGDWRVCGRLDEGWESECLRGFAVSKRDPELCKQVPVNNDRYNCYIDIASALKDPGICDLIDESIINEGLGFGINKTARCKGFV